MLDVRSLSLSRGHRTILHHLTFQCEAGVIGLIGPNGAGKSSLIEALAGDRAESCHVYWDQRPITDWPALDFAQVRACLSQRPEASFDFPVSDWLKFSRTPHADLTLESEEWAEHPALSGAIKALGIESLLERTLHTLSGGERQRVQLARTLAQIWPLDRTQRLLLLDEPLTGLDISHQHRLLRTLQTLGQRGVCTLIALHDLDLAARYCHQLLLLDQQTLVANGTPHQVLTSANLAAHFQLDADVRHDLTPWPVILTR